MHLGVGVVAQEAGGLEQRESESLMIPEKRSSTYALGSEQLWRY